MPRFDFPDLAEKIANGRMTSGLHIILCDDPLLPYLLKKSYHGLKSFEGKQAAAEFVDALSQGSLFGESFPNSVTLAEKYTDIQWGHIVKELSRLPDPIKAPPSFLFSNATLRNTVKEPPLKNIATVYLTYQPSDIEAPKVLRILLKKFSRLQLPEPDIQTLVSALHRHYGTDFLAAVLHLERMDLGELTFDEAALNQTEGDSFQVIDCLIRADTVQLALRLAQCQTSGIDAGAIFGSATYFFKQLLSVQSAIESGQNLKQAFDSMHVPYPAQARLQSAVKRIPTERVLAFFRCAAANELALRKSKSPFDLLAIELAALIT